jgi:hypothetical protein
MRAILCSTEGPQTTMSLHARQQGALDRIERTLAMDDPRLGSMLAIFTRLTQDEPMPVTEQVSGRLKWRLRPAMVISIALVAVLSALMLTMPVQGRDMCGATRAESRLGQGWSRARICLPVLKNSQERLHDHSGK